MQHSVRYIAQHTTVAVLQRNAISRVMEEDHGVAWSSCPSYCVKFSFLPSPLTHLRALNATLWTRDKPNNTPAQYNTRIATSTTKLNDKN